MSAFGEESGVSRRLDFSPNGKSEDEAIDSSSSFSTGEASNHLEEVLIVTSSRTYF